MHANLTILNHRFYPFLMGGVERRMWHVARAMARRGWAVTVLTENHARLPVEETPAPGVRVKRFDPPRPGVLWRSRLAGQVQRAWWWKRIIQDHAPEGPLWANGYPAPTLGAALAGRRRDVVFNPSTCVAATNRIARAYPPLSSLREAGSFAMLDRLAYRLAPRVLVGSKNLARQLEDHYGRHHGIAVCGHGVERLGPPMITRDAARRRLDLPADAWVVGFVGRLEACKDLGFLLQSMARMRDRAGLVALVLGDGRERERLAGQAHELGIAEHVRWLGAVNDPSPAYAAMDVLALPSVYETFGNVLLEAMAAGVPVVARRPCHGRRRPVLTASDEIVRDGETGLLVDPHDPGDLTQALETLHGNTDLSQRLGRQALQWAAAQTWGHAAEQYEALFRVWGFSTPHLTMKEASHDLRSAA